MSVEIKKLESTPLKTIRCPHVPETQSIAMHTFCLTDTAYLAVCDCCWRNITAVVVKDLIATHAKEYAKQSSKY